MNNSQVRATRSHKRRRCPACQELALVPILYGPLPASLATDRARGDLFWGGMVHPRNGARWKCTVCGRSFPDDAV